MKRYDTYKDSGVQWLGEIPGHWECTSLGRVLCEKLQYGASESGDLEYTNDSMRYIRITDITLDGKLKKDCCTKGNPINEKSKVISNQLEKYFDCVSSSTIETWERFIEY